MKRIKDINKDLDIKLNAYVSNIDASTPGVVCNAFRYLADRYRFNNIDKYFRKHGKKDYLFLSKNPLSSTKSRKVLNGVHGCCDRDRDEFPYSSTKDNTNLKKDVSILCVNSITDNRLDGSRLGRFYAASTYNNIDYSKSFPFWPNMDIKSSEIPKRYETSPVDGFILFFNIEGVDCNLKTNEPLFNGKLFSEAIRYPTFE
ncbi:hypothetical protein KGF56_003395 [Candida oxycetoniae]|uniref:Uncharacterized protein n=1 Tax=Candida oxycetoniae TaxID=497107 RepID=A0AAI9WXH0_9ASCO|nr:uncharacterized protein KGF56_003395 [Candida oxycetoniae]KAI3403760.1 hypothetical protein KGF56_003395 [Candida oxycetoniae]